MNSKTSKLFLLIFSVLAFLSCSKDETDTAPGNTAASNVYRYQIVTIDVPDTALNQNSYDATFGNSTITVVKTDEHQLVFGVPDNAPSGTASLIIPGLGNKKLEYNILEPQLTKTAEETIMPLVTLGDARFESLGDLSAQGEIAKNNFGQFKNYLENNATGQEKEMIALYYQVNKTTIDKILQFDINNPNGRFTESDIFTIQAFCTAVTVTVGGGFGIRYLQEPSLKLVSVAVAGIGVAGAIHFFDELAQRNIAVIGVKVNSFLGDNNRRNNEIVLNDDVSSIFPLQLASRKLQQSDTNISNSNIKTFFSYQTIYNDFIASVNNAITFVNNHIPFVSITTFSPAILSTDGTTSDEDISTDVRENINFTINHPNLQLTSATLYATGQLELKIKIVGSPAQLPVISALKYSYSDDLTNFTGSFPIKVNGATEFQLTGRWKLQYYNSTGTLGTFDIIDFTDGGAGIHLSTTYPDNGPVYEYDDYLYYQSYSSETKKIHLTHNRYNISYYFNYDGENPQPTLLSGQSNTGTVMELIKQ